MRIGDFDEETKFLVSNFFEDLDQESVALRTTALKQWPTLTDDASVLILGTSRDWRGRVYNEETLDSLSLLFDTIVINDPSSSEFIPQENDKAGQHLALKLGHLCEARIIRPLLGWAPIPLESWSELKAAEASLGIEWGNFIRLHPHFRSDSSTPFCRVFDHILEAQLQRDAVFRRAYRKAYPEEDLGWEPEPVRVGFWRLKQFALTPYVLEKCLGVRTVHGRDLLTTYADATLERVMRWAQVDDPIPTLTNPMGEAELLLQFLERVTLRMPFRVGPDELLELRSQKISTKLRQWWKQEIDTSGGTTDPKEVADLISDFDELMKQRLSDTELFLIDCSVTAIASTVGFFAGGLPGAIIGNVGSIPLRRATEKGLAMIRKRRVKWVYDFLDLVGRPQS